jgi:3-oxoacyl-[acyl-carrier protein] reductase
MQIRFDDKVVVITGASTGIGAAMATGFGRCGATVVVHYNSNEEAAATVVEQIEGAGGHAWSLGADLSDRGDQQRLVDEVLGRHASIDVLVNNAGGMVERRLVGEMTGDVYDKVLELNFGSVVALSNAVAPVMRRKGSGSIVNVTSIASVNGGSPGSSLYGATKGAITSYTRALARELAKDGIRVNAISPGVITTPFHDRYSTPEALEGMRATVPMGRLGVAEECVGAALFLANDELSGYITGQVLAINGGQHFLG